MWLVPVAALLLVYHFPRHALSVSRVLAYTAAGALVWVASRRPDRGLLLLVALLPFQGFILAKLWLLGMPAGVVKGLGSWKEILALGVIVAGARSYVASGRTADRVDKLGLGFVACALLYFALQPSIVPGAPASLSVRGLGFRETAGFVLLLLGARHAPMPADFAARAARTLMWTAVLVAAAGIYEALFPSHWNTFVVSTIGFTRYEVAVLGTTPLNMWNIIVHANIGGASVIRVGSVFGNGLTCGFYLLPAFAIGFERSIRRARASSAVLPTLVIGSCLLLTEVRSAILGALVIALLAFRATGGRTPHFRTQLVLVLVGLALVGIPAAQSIGVLSRFALLGQSSDSSTQAHSQSTSSGIDLLVKRPLGNGLGTGAGTGQRFAVQNLTIAENQYVEVGNELGVLPMLLFVGLTLALVVGLRQAARASPEPLPAAIWLAGAGLAVGGLFLQTWTDVSVSWTFWPIAGAVLGMQAAAVRARRVGAPGAASSGRFRPLANGAAWSARLRSGAIDQA